MKIAVVILNWNGKALLKQFLPSVVQNSPEATIYIADNASEDNSVDYVRSHFPEVKIIQNKVNGGYAKGYNDALAELEEDIYILLNSDVEVTQNWLPPMIAEFESDPRVAALQPKILDYKRKDHFEYAGAAGGFIDKLGYPYCRGRIFDTLEKDEDQYDDTVEIFWASGACLAIRKTCFIEAGRFDEDFFAHQEEIDLCWRLFNLGYKVKAVGTSSVFHLGGGTLDAMNPKKTYYNFRNSLYTVLKNAPKPDFLKIIFFRLILDGLAGLKFIFELKPSHTVAILQGHFSFYSNFSRILRKRKNNSQKKKYFHRATVVLAYYLIHKTKFSQL
ncbi:glycosyltransferase family 2 protein [Salinimicrobium gaetbulicola]|uniref:Glycosyltransferase family 2 protein n=1 Tax=Salinimicrobium gaetbulicola TaxID=999702 RepID=A0ABW3IDF0_9FLAO